MPRVLRIINRLNMGGPTYNAAYLTRYMAPEYETLLVSGVKEESEASSEFILNRMNIKPVYVEAMRRPLHPLRDRSAYREIDKIIRDFKPDIVHTHAAKAGALGRLAAKRNNVPVVVHTFHGHVFHSYFNPVKTRAFLSIERYLARQSSRIIAISEKQKKELTEDHKVCEADKVEVIPLGFDLERFRAGQEEKRKRMRQLFLLDEDEVAIGIVGRLVPIKNHALFFEAVERIRSRMKNKIRVFVVGDGELKESLLALCEKLNLDYTEGNPPSEKTLITFTSWMRNVDEVNAAMDFIALSSMNEGTPVSLIEAQAAGKPVVSTRVGGIEDFVEHGKTGLLSESGDLENFAANLYRMAEYDEMRQDYAANCSGSIVERFGYQRLVDDMDALYRKLLHSQA